MYGHLISVFVVFLNAILRGSRFVQSSVVRNFFGITSQKLQSLQEASDTSKDSNTLPRVTISRNISDGSDNPIESTSNPFPSDDMSSGTMLSMEAKGLAINQQDKWRKLYTNMRVKIKPHEIGVRCYLFEGVISGSEVAAWLIRPELNTSIISTNTSYQNARDRIEACALGQELLNCGLIVSICCGMEGDGEDMGLLENPSSSSTIVSDNSSSYGINPSLNTTLNDDSPYKHMKMHFSDKYGFIYRFRETSATARTVGSYTLFGSVVYINIPEWEYSEGDDEADITTSRDTMGVTIRNNGAITVTRPSEVIQTIDNSTKKGHVEYLVNISHGGDTWQIWKRYEKAFDMSCDNELDLFRRIASL